MSKLKKNLSLQTIYQIIVTITPLITSPYLSRKLGVDALGTYSYTYSIINYFMLFCMLGIINYGTMTIASTKNNKGEKFSEIYCVQLICCLLSSLLFIMLIFFEQNKILLLQSIWIFSCFFDVTWYFFGKENFKITVIRNLLFKVLTIISIFVFIHNSNDLWKYIIIMSAGTLIGQISLWCIAIKEFNVKKIKIKKILVHIKPILLLFIPIFAMSFFHIMDKTMLGILSTSSESGYYFNADKIVNIPLGILTGIGTVMLSNITSLISNDKKLEALNIFKKSLKYLTCISIAMCFGISAIAKDFIPLFFGPGYEKCIELVHLFSFVIILKTISDVLRTQFLIPYKKDKYFIVSVIVGSISNLILNYILIKTFNLGALGATIGTIMAELIVCLMQTIFVCKFEKIYTDIFKNYIFILFGIIMYYTINLLSNVNAFIVLKLIVEIVLGGLIYVMLCLIYFYITKDEIIHHIFSFMNKNKKLINKKN